MRRSRDRTPSPPLHRRLGRARTSPPATPPSPPSPAASSGSSSPERDEHVQEASSLNDILLKLANPMGRNALREEVVRHLRVEIQNTKEDSLTISQDIDRLKDMFRRTCEMNYQLFLSGLSSSVQGNNAHEHGLTSELESTGSGNQAMNMGGAAPENTHRSIICRLCFSRGACMLLLPCRHICACKSCEVILTHCPICVSTKASAVEV